MTANATSLKFNISVNTVRNLYKRYQAEDHCHAGRKIRLRHEDLDAYMYVLLRSSAISSVAPHAEGLTDRTVLTH